MAERFTKIGVYTSESVLKHTGKTWDQWVQALDRAGARSWSYQDIVSVLKKKFRLSPWWQQGVAIGYEVAIGRRLEGRNAKGECSSTTTKTISVQAKALWRLLASEEGMERWLKPLGPVTLKPGNFFETSDGFFGEIRTMLAGRRLRFSWQDPEWPKHTLVQLILVPRPQGKCIVAVNHEKLMDSKTKTRMAKRWRQSLDEVAQLVKSQSRTASS